MANGQEWVDKVAWETNHNPRRVVTVVSIVLRDRKACNEGGCLQTVAAEIGGAIFLHEVNVSGKHAGLTR